MIFNIEKLPGKFSPNDGTIDFYLRIRTLINKNKVVLDLGGSNAPWYNKNKNNQLIKSIQFLKKDVKKLYVADIDPIILKNRSTHKNLLIKKDKIPLKGKLVEYKKVIKGLENNDEIIKKLSELPSIKS